MRRSPHTLVLIALLLLGQALPVAGAPGVWSLCMGLDGHVAIELVHDAPACASICNPADPHDPAAPKAPDTEAPRGEIALPDDHGCLDVPLNGDDAARPAHPLRAPAPAALPVAGFEARSALICAHGPKPSGPRPTSRAGPPPGLRTTILLI